MPNLVTQERSNLDSQKPDSSPQHLANVLGFEDKDQEESLETESSLASEEKEEKKATSAREKKFC